MVLIQPARPVPRPRPLRRRPEPPAAVPATGVRPAVLARVAPQTAAARAGGRTASRLSRAVDRVPAGWWRLTALYLTGRYLVLVAAFAVVLLDPREAAADLAPLRGIGEVAVLLSGRPATVAVLASGLAGWALLLLLHAVLLRCGAPRLAGSAPLLVGASVLTAALGPALGALLVAVGLAVLGALRLLRRPAVR